jgi:hypothetical protein
MGSGALIYITSLGIQKLIGGDTQTHTHTDSNVIS